MVGWWEKSACPHIVKKKKEKKIETVEQDAGVRATVLRIF